MQRKPRDLRTSPYGPWPTEEAYAQRDLPLILRENVSFSAGFEIKTVLIDVRNQMKNVLDEFVCDWFIQKGCRENRETKDGTFGPGPTGGRPMHKKSLILREIFLSYLKLFYTIEDSYLYNQFRMYRHNFLRFSKSHSTRKQ